MLARCLIVASPFVVVWLLSARAHASPKLQIVLRGQVPFALADLERALALRTHGLPLAAKLTIACDEPGRVVVTFAERTRVVELNDRSGPVAARIVALVAVELLLPGLEPLAAGQIERIAVAGEPSAHPDQWSIVRADPTRLSVTAAEGFLIGTQSTDRFLLVTTLELSLRKRKFRAGASVGRWGSVSPSDPNELEYMQVEAWPLRAFAGLEMWRVEWLVSAFAAPYRLTDVAGSPTGVLLGAGVTVRRVFSLYGGFHLTLSAGFDAFANRVELIIDNSPVLSSTPRFAASAALGVGWEFDY